jgi:hypothetical protein
MQHNLCSATLRKKNGINRNVSLLILMCVKQNGGGDGGVRDFEQLKVN